jgi:disulfide oxidoreductase YuzD
MVEHTEDAIQIDLNVFKNSLSSFSNELNERLEMKKKEILKTKCFSGDIHEKKYVKHDKERKINKLQILPRNCTDDVKFQKNFTGMMNKLSTNNKDTLLPKIQSFIQDVKSEKDQQIVYSVLWGFMKKSFNPTYIDVMMFLDKDMITENIEKFVKKKEWYPCNLILENNVLINSNDEELYDIYCQYVKWKKETINLFQGIKLIWDIYKNNCLSQLLQNEVLDMFQIFHQDKMKVHVTDFCLEILYIFFNKSESVCAYLESIDKDKLNSSTKFLIMNFLSQK